MSAGQLALGLADRHEGQAAALAAATAGHRDYRHRLETALAELVAARTPFTADDIRQAAGEPDEDRPNLLPSVIGCAARDGLIVRCGDYASQRRARRGSRNGTWIAATASESAA
ncbi:hypothetical protein SAMN05216215_10124 [Saccharopolyspora shandongensis]|uniref:Winged helix DNA-binding domain-containing protein n=1 Tax=Saccharopolyspora shandongensis TaxID=418495 RepID=A0A1H3CEF7_9PSEU|nr:hypothetical protein [Saccharopolyspora shandongensis]SDX52506.1 hypothetical protein SAMN05216215_10124 [Saccharopolyspora shandongensis]